MAATDPLPETEWPAPVDHAAAGLMRGPVPDPDHRVTPRNWLRFPFLSWSLQHQREVLPTRRLWRGDGPVRPLPSDPADLDELRIPTGAGALGLDEVLRRTHTDAYLVAHRGVLRVEWYANSMHRAQPHAMFSMTKSLVGSILASLVVEGTIDEWAPVARYVPELGESSWGPIAVRHVADMTDGTDFDEDYASRDADIITYGRAMGFTPRREGDPAGVYEALPLTRGQLHDPGTVFSYKTPATDVIGWVAAAVTGRPIGDLLEDRIWRRIGAEHDAAIIVDGLGTAIGSGGMSATAPDLVRLGMMVADGGRVGDDQVIPAAALDAIRAGGDLDAFAAAGYPDRPGWSYRSQFWLPSTRPRALAMMGIHGQQVLVAPDEELVAVKLSCHPIATNLPTDHYHLPLFETVAAALLTDDR